MIRGYTAGAALLRTGPYVVHRGQRTADRQPVLLKTVRGAVRRAERDALEREFSLLRSLSIAGVPEALDLVPGAADGDAAVLVLDDRGFSAAPGGVRDATDLSSFFATAMALAGTLADIHRADLVCGGVAPSALLVSADGRGIQLVDFSLAARMSVDTALESAPIWGVTSYSSPEQTGRINRTVDHRSDLYSLGATLYHLLTGTPPFHSDDPLGLIHAHLAKTAVPPQALVAFVPEQVSAIVMRLLSKAAEDRYQSALGVLADLDVCAREWHATGEIRRFDPGRSDVSDRFLIPRRLYGRDRELAELTAAFDDACGGRASLLLVSGYSGIGKTSLISELYRPIVTQRGYFLAGQVRPGRAQRAVWRAHPGVPRFRVAGARRERAQPRRVAPAPECGARHQRRRHRRGHPGDRVRDRPPGLAAGARSRGGAEPLPLRLPELRRRRRCPRASPRRLSRRSAMGGCGDARAAAHAPHRPRSAARPLHRAPTATTRSTPTIC